jgi:hypothetical protein
MFGEVVSQCVEKILFKLFLGQQNEVEMVLKKFFRKKYMEI